VPTVLLVRHGRTRANADGVLAGRTPGVLLDDTGRRQALTLRTRLRGARLDAVISSPLERCVQTAALALPSEANGPLHDERVGECHYGDWTGRTLASLAAEPLWRVVQNHPSAASFPGGESLRSMQARAVEAVRDWNERLGDDGVYAVFSHGDVIKAILADALGMHLDLFQRLVVDPCSVSIVHYRSERAFVERMNDRTGMLATIGARPPEGSERGRDSDAAVGGGAGGQD
jgi:probable phosphomutase (TIGR03848 family)